ncbi:OpgC domain-containing protein [Frigidibacter albus]|uniref:OpgC domain-containing protein n=1 Tax=Frigidibacter albus TaxID=1465486 RepID=A0A6L8VLG8_9RHOB|nr:OpgC domain-containing protein [Frigidibacter albus]MZQ91208.1 OpgC domain-containing protein [Frigidibacter albus]NBE33135.1 OpgC domain-containing protein [Frigidibacter albus]
MPDPMPGASVRDARLDVLRGLALVMIFINHVPNTAWEGWTSRNFGFSDAAEGFVFMSGLAAGLAYSGGFRRASLWPAITRVWGRAWALILVHMTVTVIALGLTGAAVLWWGLPGMAEINNVPPLLADPLAGFLGLALLSHQLGYMNILPLYAVLLAVTPALLWAALRAPLALIAVSVLVWLVAGSLRIAPPTYPTESIWFFNPLSWQLLFVLGLASGTAMKQGRRLVPVRRRLVALSAVVVLGIMVWALWDDLGARLNAGMFALRDTWLPDFLFDYDKTFVSGPRLLHFLALAYLLSALPIVRRACAHRAAWPLAVLGRHGLTVFALGTVLAFAGQAVKLAGLRVGLDRDLALDTAILIAGLGLQLAVAMVRERAAGRQR